MQHEDEFPNNFSSVLIDIVNQRLRTQQFESSRRLGLNRRAEAVSEAWILSAVPSAHGSLRTQNPSQQIPLSAHSPAATVDLMPRVFVLSSFTRHS